MNKIKIPKKKMKDKAMVTLFIALRLKKIFFSKIKMF